MIIGDPQPDEVPPPVPLPDDSFRLQTTRIAGIEHHQIHQAPDHLHPGVELTLIAEPANPHDKYAVRIQFREALLGYLPRTSNHIVSRLLRQNAPLTAQAASPSSITSPSTSFSGNRKNAPTGRSFRFSAESSRLILQWDPQEPLHLKRE